MNKKRIYKLIVIGASSGGFYALRTILQALDENFPLPVVVVQHIGYQVDNFLVKFMDKECRIKVKEGEDREALTPGVVYLAPSDYHLQVEDDYTLSISSIERINYARPSIDVLFESAAYAFGDMVLGVLLTGANSDGAKGMKAIQAYGGFTIVEDPASAYADVMPKAALKLITPDKILKVEAIGPFLAEFFQALHS